MVYIWVRSTADWHDEEAFLAQVQARFRPTLEVWHETFEMPYHRMMGELMEELALR